MYNIAETNLKDGLKRLYELAVRETPTEWHTAECPPGLPIGSNVRSWTESWQFKFLRWRSAAAKELF